MQEQDNDSVSHIEEDLISRATSVKDVVNALAKRGCLDLTSEIDPALCSTFPLHGGGFCDVYRGSIAGGKQIAIKSLRIYERPGRSDGKEKILKRAARELYNWSKLRHPNVLPLMGLAIFREQMSMISEWMENGSLVSYVRLNPKANRIRLVLDVCIGLTYLHSNEMVHGDLKAANVMVSYDGTAMLADFGNSQLKEITLRFTDTTCSSLSLRWAAPELLLEGPQLSKKADVYACGMTILETLTGKVPYNESSDEQVLFMVAFNQKTPTRPETGMSEGIWEILQQCWKPSPERPEIDDIKNQLQLYSDQTPPKEPAQPISRPQSAQPQRDSSIPPNDLGSPHGFMGGPDAVFDFSYYLTTPPLSPLSGGILPDNHPGQGSLG